MYIDTQESLEELIAVFARADFMTIDTEFLHDKTYYPKLCLIQIATEDVEAIIDPLASLDLSPLKRVLTDERIMKVFHAGVQDCTVLYNILGTPVRPIFDIQHAMLLLGQSQQISLAAVVRQYCDVSLKKVESYSDWSQRPLTEEQISYAIDDVRYLPAVYRKIVLELEASGRLDWLKDDFRHLEEESYYVIDDRSLWKKLKGVRSLTGQQLAIARELCSWREMVAQSSDLPRKWILPDDFIIELSRRSVDTLEDIYKIRGVKRRLNQNLVKSLLDSVARGKREPQANWPVHDRAPLSVAGITAKIDLMTALLHFRAKESSVATSYLCSHEDLVRLASGKREGLAVLEGWRADLIGNELMQLLDGDLSLTLKGDDLKVTLLSQAGMNTANR